MYKVLLWFTVMIKPICERGKKCLYLIKKIEEYSYNPFPRSQFTLKGKELCYYCNNPKRFSKWLIPKKLAHEQKFKECGFKVTDKLEQFIES